MQKVQSLLFSQPNKILHDWMRGVHTAEEVNRYVADELGICYQPLWGLFVRDCKNMKVPNDLLGKINSLRHHYVTVLITGNMDSFTRLTVPALKLDRYFDHISCSYYKGKHKTDDAGQLFMDCVERLRIPLSDSVLIDDNNVCCEIFTSLGGTVHQTELVECTRKILSDLLL